MKEVRIRFGSNVRHLSLPASYDEMTERQFRAYIDLADSEISTTAFWRVFGLKTSEYLSLPYWVKVELDDALAFTKDLEQPCSKMLLTKLKCGLTTLRTCGERLSGMSLQQFMAVDSYFSYYGVTQDVMHLYRMVASLYMEKGVGFVLDREHKSLVDVERQAKRLQKLVTSMWINAIYMNWVLVKNWLSVEFKHLFPRGESEGGKPQPANWLELFDSFVGDNIPHMEDYQRMECMDAFRILDKKIHEQQKIMR